MTKKIICFGLILLLTLALLPLSACGENERPPAGGGEAPAGGGGALPSGPPAGGGTAPPPAGQPENPPPPDETMAGIRILTYVTDVYAIEYPNYWSLNEGEENTGYEALTFWKKDPDVYEDGGKGGQDPNSAKVSLSILPKEGKTIGDIALAEIDFTEEELRSENLTIDGKKAVRYISLYGEDQIINTYIDWSETEYFWLAGYHGTGNERDTMHRDVLFIHNSLRAAGAN
ncbi:MAG: hypothetical protein LBH21_05580 [Gracilibacteraceae bacterium]|jgi:hypothetical protein|nr:hypothetical protein [Gracilibacteraceae bacterium]